MHVKVEVVSLLSLNHLLVFAAKHPQNGRGNTLPYQCKRFLGRLYCRLFFPHKIKTCNSTISTTIFPSQHLSFLPFLYLFLYAYITPYTLSISLHSPLSLPLISIFLSISPSLLLSFSGIDFCSVPSHILCLFLPLPPGSCTSCSTW